MEAQRKRLKPRLDRRNAMKNIDYQVPYSPSFNDTATPSFNYETSFRVKGIDGEFDHIFRSLGLSGPEDFAIPTAAWEQAQKSRLSSSSPVATNNIKPKVEQDHEHQIPPKRESGVGLNADVVLKSPSFQQFVAEENVKDGEVNVCSSDSSKVLGENFRDGGGCGGIKGARPPVLAPPVMLRPLVDDDDDDLVDTPSLGDDAPSREQDERGVEESGGDLDVDAGERNLVSDSSSSTSHDDDSDVGGETEEVSGVVDMSNVHNVSPNGSFRRTFISWQKGEILGKGSFGTVYEGFTQ